MIKCLLFNTTEFQYLSRPMGAHRIATFLRQQDIDVEVIDWANHWTLEELKQLFESRYDDNMKFIAFSHMFSLWNSTLEEFCSWVKAKFPDLPILSGSGVNPMFESKQIDYYIQGFGEHAITELIKYIVGNGKRPRFKIDAPNGKRIIPANDFYPAFPMKSLLVKYEDRDFIDSHEWLTVEFSRGCKFACDFCNFPVIGVRGDYTRDADDFELQMRDTYDRFGVTNYIVADETFNDRTEKITKFANVVEKLPFDPWFSGFIRADLSIARKHEREELLRMNFLGHYYGIESFNNDSAKIVGKGMDTERIQTGLIDIKNYFLTHKKQQYRGDISLILGLPYDTYDSLESTLAWLIEHWQTQAFSAYVLEIPKGKFDTPSKISQNYPYYGYKEMTDEEIKQGHMDNIFPIKAPGVSSEPFFWKTENLTYFDAIKYLKKFTDQKLCHDFRISNFGLAHRFKDALGIDERLSLKNANASDKYTIQDYKIKKLNWS